MQLKIVKNTVFAGSSLVGPIILAETVDMRPTSKMTRASVISNAYRIRFGADRKCRWSGILVRENILNFKKSYTFVRKPPTNAG